MALHHVLALLLALCTVGAGCLAPTATTQEAATESTVPESPSLYGSCTLNTISIDGEPGINVDESERLSFEELSADQQAEFLGHTTDTEDGTDWNTSVRYVQYEGEWYSTVVECP